MIATFLSLTTFASAGDQLYGHFVIRGVAKDLSGPRVSQLLGTETMGRLCDSLNEANIFLCHYNSDRGAGGKLDVSLTPEQVVPAIMAHAKANNLFDTTQIDFIHAKDHYIIDNSGIYGGRSKNGSASSYRNLKESVSGIQAPSPTVLSYLNKLYTNNEYIYDTTGQNVTVYVVDTLANVDLPEFKRQGGSNIVLGWSSFSANITKTAPCASEHGSHVTSLIGGTTYGVAKNAKIVSVAVSASCGAASRSSELASGLDYVIATIGNRTTPTVVAISMLVLDGPAGSIISDQVSELISMGVIVISAAGDASDDSCLYVPSKIPMVITVSATEMKTRRSGFPWEGSNYGSCVTIWSPGAKIEAASALPAKQAIFSGTSQAMALVTGIVAQILEVNPNYKHAEVIKALHKQADNTVMAWDTPNTVSFFAQTKVNALTCKCP